MSGEARANESLLIKQNLNGHYSIRVLLMYRASRETMSFSIKYLNFIVDVEKRKMAYEKRLRFSITSE